MSNTQHLFQTEGLGSYTVPGTPVYLTLDNYKNFESKLMITSMSAQNAVNYQLNYAFNDDAYAYVFGDRLSIVGMTGIAMSITECADGSQSPIQITPQDFVDFYKKFKLGDATEPAVLVAAKNNGIVIRGYFISMDIQLVYNRPDAYQFSFQMLGRVAI